ncbi:MAG: co-chaperone GroES [Odoribacter sp.]|nr:co-chaperone GroES [Bacteroidales bacterium]MBR2981033.1 co-chaperone GroES [Odoribacter sp.]
MAIKAILNKIIVEPVEAETKTASGIIIPDSAQEKPNRGKVIATGNGTKDEPMEVKVGDIVVFGKYSGTELNVDGDKYIIMSQNEVLAIL